LEKLADKVKKGAIHSVEKVDGVFAKVFQVLRPQL
jgi:hypothetical protein